MDEDGAGGFARRSRNIFADAQRRQWCRERQIGERRGGAASAKTGATALRCSNKRFVEELRLRETLEKHGGCVNCVSWNDDASLLISGSDDMTVCVWGCGAKMPLKGSAFTGHTHNVFASEFVPQSNSAYCVTTSADGDVRLVDLERGFRGPAPAHYGYRLRGGESTEFRVQSLALARSRRGDGVRHDVRAERTEHVFVVPSRRSRSFVRLEAKSRWFRRKLARNRRRFERVRADVGDRVRPDGAYDVRRVLGRSSRARV